MGSINGRVTDSKSQPIETALVLVKGTNIGEYTNENGEYRLVNIPVGSRTVIIRGVGLKEKSINITVLAGRTTHIPDVEDRKSTRLNSSH